MKQKYELAGWILFVACAGFFIVSAVKSGDIWYLIGSIIFLVACIIFIISLVKGRNDVR